MVRLRWSLPALNDLHDIASFIADDAPRRASSFIKEIISASERLCDFPSSGRKVPDSTNSSLRELIFGNYRIIYKFDTELVEIVAVIHSARRFDISIFD